MSLETGELVAAGSMPSFDFALVAPDVCVVAAAERVAAYDSESLKEVWRYSRPGERYHSVARSGERVFVVYSIKTTKKRGVLALKAKSGKFDAVVIAPKQTTIHDIAADEKGLVVLLDDLEAALPRETLIAFLSQSSDEDLAKRGPSLLSVEPGSSDGDAPLWFERVPVADADEAGDIATCADSGKLYVVRGAMLEVRDALTGRTLGDWAVPGLDERLSWSVAQGAGLLAEETRVSVFELPA
jgi:hypothetical protein